MLHTLRTKRPASKRKSPQSAVVPQFSDGEEEDPVGGAGSKRGRSKKAVDWELPGFDFSGIVAADRSQPVCLMCGKRRTHRAGGHFFCACRLTLPVSASRFELQWDSRRSELVVEQVVMLHHVIYHQGCADTKRNDWLLQGARERLARWPRVALRHPSISGLSG